MEPRAAEFYGGGELSYEERMGSDLTELAPLHSTAEPRIIIYGHVPADIHQTRDLSRLVHLGSSPKGASTSDFLRAAELARLRWKAMKNKPEIP
jgi:hypothetical protein